MKKLILYTDGGSRGNPGPGATGVIIRDEEGNLVHEAGKYLGLCTNNEAEYQALILGMELALHEKADELDCFLDSELVVKQLNGEYKVRHEKLIKFYKEIKEKRKLFQKITFHHIPRIKNKEADALVNEILDSVDESKAS